MLGDFLLNYIHTYTIYSTELKFKKESNYNIIITGFIDHGLHIILSHEPKLSTSLHVTYQLYFFILKSYIP